VAIVRDEQRQQRFEALFRLTYEPLQRYLRRRCDPGTAEDVLADALLVLWRRLDDVPEEAPLAWAYGVARGCLANNVRSAARQAQLVVRLSVPLQPGPPDSAALDEAWQVLPDTDREVLRLWAWEHLAPREIAEVLGISPNAASIRLHRALGKLRAELAPRKEDGSDGHLEQRRGRESG